MKNSHIMDRKMETSEDMKEFVEFEKSLPKRFHILNNEIDKHYDSCWKCRNIPFFTVLFHKETYEKMKECDLIIRKKMCKI